MQLPLIFVDKEEIGSTGNTGMLSAFFEMTLAEIIEKINGNCTITDLSLIHIYKITELQSSGMSKMIIDLRDNPGGVLDEACNMADMILPEGIITYTETKSGKRTDYNSDAESLDIPIVILINENSASASEVFTGALKDYGKACLLYTSRCV